MLIFIAAIVLYALLHGKPGWLFPWLGYALLPVVAAGVSLLYLPQGWRLVTLLLYVPLVLWLSCFITIKFIRRDWLYSALMLLPVPTFVGWYMAGRGLARPDLRLEFLYGFAPWTALTFLLLGVSAVLVVRMKSRTLRTIAIIVSGLTSTAMVAFASDRLDFTSFLELAVLMLAFVLVPAFIERRLARNSHTIIP
jgi:cation transport ATPase